MKQIIECIPNVSEGKNTEVIEELASVIMDIDGVRLLNVDAGTSANRTVFTFAGNPLSVVNAAFQLIKKASQVIDMRMHKGTHPRMGAVDVCPFVPVTGISMDETVKITDTLARKIGNDLQLPVYCYGYSAKDEKRFGLENIRRGEYEGLSKKIMDPLWQPDYGPAEFIPQFGAVAMGTRDFLIAYNVNLDTRNVSIAKEIAAEIRESGRVVENIFNETRVSKRIHGKLKAVKAIGWYANEYNCAQVSTNIIDYRKNSLIEVFQTISECALQKNIKVTGSEIIGLIPLGSIISDNVLINNPNRFLNSKEFIEVLAEVQKKLKLQIQDEYLLRERILEYSIHDFF